jgi:hypothetical protein
MDDPLTLAVAPPLNETPEQRTKRELAETRAKMISDEIDGQLQSERAARKGKKKPVKVLVLGQSESGEYFAPSILTAHKLNCFISRKNCYAEKWDLVHLQILERLISLCRLPNGLFRARMGC